jgi:hypothetical protein
MHQSHLLLFTESHVSSQCFILMEEYVYLYNSIQSHDCHIQQYSHMTLPYTTLYSRMTLPYTTVYSHMTLPYTTVYSHMTLPYTTVYSHMTLPYTTVYSHMTLPNNYTTKLEWTSESIISKNISKNSFGIVCKMWV